MTSESSHFHIYKYSLIFSTDINGNNCHPIDMELTVRCDTDFIIRFITDA